MSTIKKELFLDGLCCANCATKIEQEVSVIDGVKQACMNFTTQTLTIEATSDGNIDDVLSLTNEIIKKHEPNVVVKE